MRVKGKVYLIAAELPALNLFDCVAELGVFADGVRVQGNVFLRQVILKGQLRLRQAHIGGVLDCSDASLAVDGSALIADGAQIAGSVFLNQNFSSSGTVSFLGSHIGGVIDCSGATLTARDNSFLADGAKISGSVFLNRSFSAAGAIGFRGAQIGGDLDCSGANIDASGSAFSADGAKITGSVYLNQGFIASCPIGLIGVQIGGDLVCSDANLNTADDAIRADRARISGDVFLNRKFTSAGKIRFLGTHIGGDLDCSGANLSAKKETLRADAAKITGYVYLNEKFSSSGTVGFIGSHIGGDLDCSGASFTAPEEAIVAERVRVSGSVFLNSKFSSTGVVNLSGAQITGDLDCSGAKITSLICEEIRIEGKLTWIAIQESKHCSLRLLAASINTLHDDTSSWPRRGQLVVRGLQYKDLVHHRASTTHAVKIQTTVPQQELNARERIQWLNLQSEEDSPDPQAWMWLAKHFKEKGQDNRSRWVVLQYRLKRAKAENWLVMPVRTLLDLLSWEPFLVLIPFLLILLWGSLTYRSAWYQQEIQPTVQSASNQVSSNAPSIGKVTFSNAYPAFNPWIYTLENELPLVKFGMDDKWAPDPGLIARQRAGRYWYLAALRWFLILAGWAQGIMLTLGINRRFRD